MTWVRVAQRVLLLADEHRSADLTQRLLQRVAPASHVDTATDLATARTLIGSSDYDLAILDVSVPDGFGLDLVDDLGAGGVDFPIVVLTGDDDRTGWRHAADVGATAVLSKASLDHEQLAGALEFVYKVTAGTCISLLTTSLAQQLGTIDTPDVVQILDRLVADLNVTSAGLQIWNADADLVADHRSGPTSPHRVDAVLADTIDRGHSITRSIHGWNLFLWLDSSPRRWGRIEAPLLGLCDAILAAALLTERQREVDASERRYRAVADATGDPVIAVDSLGVVVASNAALTDEIGSDPVGRHLTSLSSLYPPLKIAIDLLAKVTAVGRAAQMIDQPIRRGTSTRWYSGWAVPSADAWDGAAAHVVLRETTARVLTESELSTLALTDPLTGLANRRLAADRLQHALDQVGRRDGLVLVAQLDIDHFKSINDLYGHAAGDGVLAVLGERLEHLLRTADTSARLGGDEFLMIAEGVPHDEAAHELISRTHDELCRPVTLDNRTLEVGVSMGYTLIGTPGLGSDEVLRQVDSATYRAKNTGRRRAVKYEEDDRVFGTAAETALELRRAFEDHRFVFRYQPIMLDGVLVSAEALVRLDHPEHGEVQPVEFIDALVDSPLIIPTGNQFITQVLDQLHRWMADGVVATNFCVHVNIAPQQLSDPQFVDHVIDQLAAQCIPPTMLSVEITEQALVDLSRRSSGLKRLAEVGVGIYLDDFGTGASSITHLRSSALTGLKVDRSFVSDTTDPRDGEIVEGLVALGNSLGMDVVIEGVETETQLSRFGRDHTAIQGFVYSAPLLPDDFAAWVSSFAEDSMAEPA